jgi:hypothetical protein
VAWTLQQKRDAVIEAPLVDSVGRADTQVIAREGWYQVITPSAPGTLHNEVLFSQVESAHAERTIDGGAREACHEWRWSDEIVMRDRDL